MLCGLVGGYNLFWFSFLFVQGICIRPRSSCSAWHMKVLQNHFFMFKCFHFFLRPHSLFFASFEAITMGVSFLLFPLLIVCCCTLPSRGAVCFPPNCSTRTPTDTLMTTALCASPAARMRRGRDERRAEGAVTCGRAARACGAEHIFLSLLFCFCCAHSPDGVTRLPSFLRASLSPHTHE
uniref:Tcc1i14-1.2 n=1 Tax=Trypanosoma cruzi TaxID=5693 RepID=Q8T2W5_TRYCR|nr:Tcc1i14-1.2 [Trypanosoma cruzi]